MPAPIKPYNKKELANLYEVSVKVLRKWLRNHKELIGSYDGKSYTPAQVRMIFEKLGEP